MKQEQILKYTFILQEREVTTPLGTSRKEWRLNPWNPFTYIALILSSILYGLLEVYKALTESNPFKWN